MAPIIPEQLGSNRPGQHPAAGIRPVDLPEWSIPTESGYTAGANLIGEPAKQQSPFKVFVVGAGAAGIDFLHHARERLGNLKVDIKVFDKNADVS